MGGSFFDRYGPWAFVAGASAGLGSAFADQAARRGTNVILCARRSDVMERTAAELRDRHGVEVRTVTVDMGSPDLDDVVAAATDDVEVGLFIYNAAAEPQGRFLTTPTDELLTNITVNCVTPTVLTKRFAAAMVSRGRGGIVLVSSMGALQGVKIFAAYGAAKAYELILGEGLWDELRDQGVDACAYVVGATATPNFVHNANKMTPPDPEALARVLGESGNASVAEPRTPEDVAAALFEQLGTGPRLYSHPDDAASASHAATLPREEAVARMGRLTELFWK